MLVLVVSGSQGQRWIFLTLFELQYPFSRRQGQAWLQKTCQVRCPVWGKRELLRCAERGCFAWASWVDSMMELSLKRILQTQLWAWEKTFWRSWCAHRISVAEFQTRWPMEQEVGQGIYEERNPIRRWYWAAEVVHHDQGQLASSLVW